MKLETSILTIQRQVESGFSMMVKQMTDEETRTYHRNKLYEMSKGLEFLVPQLEEPTYEQKCWVLRRLKAPSWTWRSYR